MTLQTSISPPARAVFIYDAAESRRTFDLGLAELPRYRELIWVLIKRDLTGFYQQSLFGLVWRIFPPLLTMGGFSLVLSLLGVTRQGNGTPLFLILFVGLLPWHIFNSTLNATLSSITANSALIKKTYFPRLIAPLVAAADKVIDLCLGVIVLCIMLWVVGLPPWKAVLIVPFLAWAMMLAFAIGIWLTWANAAFRDIGHALPIVTQLIFYGSPIVYPIESLPAALQPILRLNPIAAIVNAARAAVLQTVEFHMMEAITGIGFTAILLVTGLTFFRRVEAILADVL